jgi:hypothetical protein
MNGGGDAYAALVKLNAREVSRTEYNRVEHHRTEWNRVAAVYKWWWGYVRSVIRVKHPCVELGLGLWSRR